MGHLIMCPLPLADAEHRLSIQFWRDAVAAWICPGVAGMQMWESVLERTLSAFGAFLLHLDACSIGTGGCAHAAAAS